MFGVAVPFIEEGGERKFFETWQRQAYDPVTWSMGYYDDYVGTVDIYQLDEQDQRRYGIRLIECFPKDIGGISFNSSPGADIQKINIGFSFRYWQNLTDEAKLPISLLDNLTTRLVNAGIRNITANLPAVIRR